MDMMSISSLGIKTIIKSLYRLFRKGKSETLMSGDGMANMITQLTAAQGGITSANLWTEAASAAGLITGLFIFAFGYRIVKKLVKGGYKGKVNM